MKHLEHLVVGVDGSAGSELALRWASAQSPKHLTLVHGFSPGLELLSASVQINLDGVRAEHDSLLATTWAEAARESGADIHTVLVDDSPAHALAHIASARGADTIVIGHQGHRRWSQHHVGETAGRLLHRCDVPLILTSDKTAPEPLAGTIVVGLSRPSEASNPELCWALDVAESQNLQLHVVSLVEPLAYVDVNYPLDMTRIHDDMRSQMDSLVETLRAHHGSIGISSEVRDGPVLAELAAAAEEVNAAMVVVGSHHPGPITGFFAGSVARLLPPLLDCPMAAIPRT